MREGGRDAPALERSVCAPRAEERAVRSKAEGEFPNVRASVSHYHLAPHLLYFDSPCSFRAARRDKRRPTHILQLTQAASSRVRRTFTKLARAIPNLGGEFVDLISHTVDIRTQSFSDFLGIHLLDVVAV